MISLSYFTLLSSLLSLTQATVDFGSSGSADACILGETPSVPGFDVRVFSYPFMDNSDFQQASYVETGYLQRPLLDSTTGITSINMNLPSPDYGSPALGSLYGMSVDVTNYTAEITSYFYAQEDGMYTLQFDNIDDSGALFFADGSAFICCQANDIVSDPTYRMVSFKVWHGDYDNKQQYHQYLKAGYYYPLKIVWTNVVSSRILQFSVVTPSGTVISDSSTNQFFSPAGVSDESECSQTVIYTEIVNSTTSWTGHYTSTTVYEIDGQGVTNLVLLPDPTTTFVYPWTGTTESSAFVTPTGAGTWTETIYTPRATDATTNGWTGTYDSTYSTSDPVDANLHATIYVETADARTTTTTIYSGSSTSYSTGTPVAGQDTVTVEVFTPRGTDTTVVGYTGTTNQTSTTIIPQDLNNHATVVINTPDPRITETTPWTGVYNTSTTEDQVIPGGTVTVEVFTARGIDYTTQGWTGTVISTYGTYSPTDPNQHATVYVEIPDPRTTTTEAWTGAYNYSTTDPVYGASGTVTIEVFTARGTYYTTRGWTGTIATTYATVSPIDPNQEVAVYVEIPDPRTTIDVYWTNSYESTLTTVGQEYGNDTVTVEDLIPRPTVTTTEMWTGSYTSLSTYAPADANETATVYIDIPKPTLYYTEAWSQTYTSFSTEFPNSPSGNVIVHEFDPAIFTTVTETWTGLSTSYYTGGLESGTIDIYELVPEATTTVTNYWPGDYTSYYTDYPINVADTVTVYENDPQHVYTITDHETETLTSTTCPLSGETATTTSVPVDLLSGTSTPSTPASTSIGSTSEIPTPSTSVSESSDSTSVASSVPSSGSSDSISVASSVPSSGSSSSSSNAADSSLNENDSSTVVSALFSATTLSISSSTVTSVSVQSTSSSLSVSSSVPEIDYSNAAAQNINYSVFSIILSAVILRIII